MKIHAGVKKRRISVTITPSIDMMINQVSRNSDLPKSTIVEQALKYWFQNKLKSDAKKLANMKFDDLPNEKEWDALQNENFSL